mmetsp:Transcript_24345/g.56552  ORF Transcript_24345/g.56552 Transcript_24345/m.56552 type:complete len:213 (-) Transcript_24345:1823-2461(-)
MKVSPLFLLAAPWNSLTTPWTTSAIWFTNVITFACNTSVAVLKSLILATATMHSTRSPGIIASTTAVLELPMLCPMMLAPASPKPNAKRDPNLIMVFSRITVSMASFFWFDLQKRTSVKPLIICLPCARVSFLARAFSRSSTLNSSSAIFMATRGSSAISSTRLIIASTGLSTRALASLENVREATHSTMHTNNVMSMPNIASSLVNGRKSK